MKAIHDRIIIRPLMEITQTASGISIPVMGGSKIGRVVSVGKGRLLDNGEYSPPDLKEGDTVIVGQFSEMQNEDGVFWVTTEKDILGVLEP